ncbi:MAG: elongation factor 4 [Elusimicrobia bacterium]|jgi:GTP-binding protein LepA|nr:elongation factor 4 [Elusimicrobiota bacterium]MBK7544890.1 elongation factor 4 [Elusimicrobiota bacterium]MBK7574402.1 elongation factor 4 [Elusimicrobiota bacterium]MBK7688234.1 elongation factor 4 [Elusimicrobiota bacterium]MBK8126548.1 elongation factor 4 [Elusimicrobiota bacterium]
MDIQRIRNFSIIAHIDHGKSTLADRLLEETGTVPRREMRAQILDGMELERERGITIKAKAVRMMWNTGGQDYLLNLIDTPGHVDFTYEVSRALAACEGALLLVDASQGVEAQTLANAQLALDAGLTLIPVINKIDLPSADPEGVKKQLRESLGLDGPYFPASAKEGKGVPEILQAIVERVPAPSGDPAKPLSALAFDSIFDSYRGVIVYVRMLDGVLKRGMQVRFMATGSVHQVEEVGHLKMKYIPADRLSAGEAGYAVCGIKDIHMVKAGDTLTEDARPTTSPHPGYREMKPFVFAGLYPVAQADYENLKKAIEKLHLEDAALNFQAESSVALGFGFRCGFLGLLHMDIIQERIRREFNVDLLVTAPTVIYRVTSHAGQTAEYDSPAKFPAHGDIKTIEEPYVSATVVVPSEFVGSVMQLCQDRRGRFLDMRYLTPTRVVLKYEMPLSEIVVDFYDALKSISKGYASFDYDHAGYRPGELLRMDILINNEEVDAFSFVVPEAAAYQRGREICERLRELIPRQMFEIPIQARIGGRILARETVRAMRKDVLAKCYGGDISRKRKLLEKQKEGKKRMRQFGAVEIPQEAFLAVLRRGDDNKKED